MRFVITGANRGIGLELVRQLVARGDEVIGTSRDPDTAVLLHSTRAAVMRLDVTDEVSVRAFAAALEDLSVDVLVNNAGVRLERDELEDLDLEQVARTYSVNAIGALRVTVALLPALIRGKGKKIVHVSSRMGSIAENSSGGSYGYRMSKAAMNMMARSLAMDLRDRGIMSVAMNPGWVKTDMGGANAPTSVEDSAQGIIRQIDGLTLDRTGELIDFLGRGAVPW